MYLLFDLDGTLTDPYQGITRSISHALLVLGRPVPLQTDLSWCIGPPLKDSFAQLLGSDDNELLEDAIAIYRDRFGSVGLFENEVYQDIPEVLNSLQEAGNALYIATSKPTVYAQKIAAHFGFQQYFNTIYGSELDGTRSDKASLLSHILQSEEIAPSKALMVGDRRHDMIGAQANRIPSVGVLWGYGTQAELEASGAHTCISHPQELNTITDYL